MRQSDIAKIRELAMLMYDSVDIKEDEWGLVVDHPFVSYMILPYRGVSIDVRTTEGRKWFRDYYQNLINRSSIARLSVLLVKQWRLGFFKYAHRYMSPKDYADFLKTAWITCENPNQDSFVSRYEAISFFRNADKELIMNDDERAYYSNLSTQVTVYRGVAKGQERLGLSWTDNIDKAIWFRDRWGENYKNYLLKATITKKDILCYFNERDENELVCDIGKLQNIQEIR